jgi:hypothetical protein
MTGCMMAISHVAIDFGYKHILQIKENVEIIHVQN